MSYQEQTTASMGTGPVDERLRTATIMETAETMREISEFVAAIRAAGLTDDLRTPDLKTLFAPTNDAVRGLRPEQLRDVAAWHIAIGRQTEADLRTASELRTLAGPLPVTYRDGQAHPGGARIVRHDIPCVNGQIHLVDQVVRSAK